MKLFNRLLLYLKRTTLKTDKGFSLVELGIVIGLVATTTLVSLRMSSFLIQANNGLTFRMQRLELQRNLRHVFFNGDHCSCLFNGISTPFNAEYNFTDNDFVIRQIPSACDSPIIKTMLTSDPDQVGLRATSITLKNMLVLGDPANSRRAMGRLEYTIESPKDILGPRSYTDSLLFTVNLQDPGNGRLTIGSCGKQPSDDIIANPSPRGISLTNSAPPIPHTGDIPGSDTGYYLAQLDIRSGNNPRIQLFMPPISATSRPIDTYDFSTGTDGHIESKSLLVMLPIFSGFFYYKQNNGDNRSQLTPIARVPLGYGAEIPTVQFSNYKAAPIGSVGLINIPVTISQTNPGEDVIVQYKVAPRSANITSAAATDYTLTAPQTLTFPAGTATLTQNIPITINGPLGGGNKYIILRLNVVSGGLINYPNEHIVRF